MSDRGYSFRSSMIQALTQAKRPDVPLRVVLRNTAAVVLPLAVGMATGHTAIGLGVGAGALNTMFSDQPGPYRQRILATAVGGAGGRRCASLCGMLIGDQLWPMLAATVAVRIRRWPDGGVRHGCRAGRHDQHDPAGGHRGHADRRRSPTPSAARR